MKWFLASLAAFAAQLSAAAALAAPSGEPSVGLPRDISLEGHRIDWLLQVTNGFIILLFVIMCIWMVVAGIKHTQKAGHKADYDHGTSRHSIVVALTLSCLIFLVVDGNLFYNSMVDLNEAFWNFERTKTDDVVRIEINARQWAWEMRYAGPDGKFATQDDVVSLNEMVVPVDRPIAVQLRSVDVIHSFYLPNLRVKTDAVPGTTTRTWFQVSSENLAASGDTEFDIACAQHCGTHHYKMKGLLRVLDAAQFAAWSQEAAINARLDYVPDPTAEEVQSGARLAPKYGPHWGWAWETLL